MSEINPWAVETVVAPEVAQAPSRPVRAARAWKPGAQVSMVSGLPIVSSKGQDCPLWVVAAHGGAGATSWARLLGAGDAGVAWPATQGYTRAVVVARSSFTGLKAAQAAAIQWASGQVEGVELVGLILTADVPGKPVKSLVEFRKRIEGAFPRVWHVGFQPAWRASLAWDVPASRDVRKVLKELSLIGKES
ncbi:MAG: hypothetical protein Q4D87_05760 [Actinomycetaceae bacterium]|nr:hypothetical protein [Actinomycetaceae bacterium]